MGWRQGQQRSMEEIEGKSSLKWCQLVKEEAGLEYTRTLVGQEGIRLRFRLRTGSAGLFEDKKRCRMCDDERCVLCNSSEVDVEHFLVRCEEFRWERQALLEANGRNTRVDQTLRLLPNIFLREYSEEVLQLPPEHLSRSTPKLTMCPLAPP